MGTKCQPELRVTEEHGFRFLWLRTVCLREDESFFRSYRDEVDGVGLARRQGFEGASTRFLDSWDIEALNVADATEIDLRPVRSLVGLRALRYTAGPQPLDLSRLTSLRLLHAVWHRRMRLPESLESLRECALWNLAPKDGSLGALASAVQLERLDLTQGGVRSLAGCPTQVRFMELFGLANLWSIEGLPHQLEELHISGSKMIQDFGPISRCRGLRVLVLGDCGEVGSLRFLHGLSGLERVVLSGDTRVRDGDMHPLVGIEDVSFKDRRGYNLTLAEVRQASRHR